MQQSLFEQHFPQINCDEGPVFFKLRAANGLELPYTSYAVLDIEVEGVTITGREVVVAKDEHCTHPLVISSFSLFIIRSHHPSAHITCVTLKKSAERSVTISSGCKCMLF